ncbi:hypothetical protein MMC22_012044 [Lobaria immixta]|nr:hypothetical protein [Lobaria immixta]
MTHSTFSPFGNDSAAPPTNWQAEPNTRGTWTIITTCLITLGLCLWTVLHLNIPGHNGMVSQPWRKLGWLLTGLLAPEIIVFHAFEQRRAAIRLTKEIHAIFGETPESKWRRFLRFVKCGKRPQPSDGLAVEMCNTRSQARRHSWTHVHSFYALMGGFVFDTSRAKPNFLPNGRSRLTISPWGLEYILKHSPSLIPDLSEDEIRDKGNADGLAKSLVCLQAVWFGVQCIVRLAQNKVISLLELNTFGHAICTLIIYALWWDKPLDIDSPTFLVEEEAWEICALMCVTSTGAAGWDEYISSFIFNSHMSESNIFWRETELSRGVKYGEKTITKWSDIFNGRYLARLCQHQVEPRIVFHHNPVPDHTNDCGSRIDETLQVLQPSDEIIRIKKGDSLSGFRCIHICTDADWYRVFPLSPPNSWRRYTGAYRAKLAHRQRIISKDAQTREACNRLGRECVFEPSDQYRWDLVSRAWQKYQPKLHECGLSTGDERGLYNGVCDRIGISMISTFGQDSYQEYGIRTLVLTIAGGFYGGLHLLAWGAPFASSLSQLAWRVSAVLVASLALVVLLIILLSPNVSEIKFPDTSNLGLIILSLILFIIAVLISLIVGTATVIATILYIPARGILVVESCLQIARLPPGAYEVPDWSRYVPHIG